MLPFGNEIGLIEPFHKNDAFDLFLVNITRERNWILHSLKKKVLIKRGIISTINKEGKRAFEKLNHIKILGVAHVDNIGSNKILQSIGLMHIEVFH